MELVDIIARARWRLHSWYRYFPGDSRDNSHNYSTRRWPSVRVREDNSWVRVCFTVYHNSPPSIHRVFWYLYRACPWYCSIRLWRWFFLPFAFVRSVMRWPHRKIYDSYSLYTVSSRFRRSWIQENCRYDRVRVLSRASHAHWRSAHYWSVLVSVFSVPRHREHDRAL